MFDKRPYLGSGFFKTKFGILEKIRRFYEKSFF